MTLKKKNVFVAAITSLLLLAACDDDSSTSPITPSNNEQSSSSIDLANSSSSSRHCEDCKDEANSSSSINKTNSSIPVSLSSSSLSVEQSSSAALVENGWSWDVPKEAYLNSAITYGSMTDSRDGQTYKTVKIGDQIWMAENLNYADSINTPSLLKRSWCYNNVAANCAVGGRFYTWTAAIDSVKLATDADNPQDCGFGRTCTLPAKVQGICPDGWHLPTYTEWIALLTEVGGSATATIACKILKSQTGWCDYTNGTDGVGFSALPAGSRNYYGDFSGGGCCAYFWSATGYGNYSAYNVDMGVNTYLSGSGVDNGFSVRCLKDEP